MSDITLEKTHALLEKLAKYVMTELPTRKELDDKLALKADKADVQRLDHKVNHLDNKINMILEGMDAQTKRLEKYHRSITSIASSEC